MKYAAYVVDCQHTKHILALTARFLQGQIAAVEFC